MMPTKLASDDALRKSRRIALLNDRWRKYQSGNGETLISSGITGRGECFVKEILEVVRYYNRFTTENDPLGEHDFGVVKISGESVIWRIDYINNTCGGWSADLADTQDVLRRLSIFLQEEQEQEKISFSKV
jgi:hypothetical protein